ncbi:MAG: trans-sulfuration enzyme family protein [Flavobacteriaceae bacterium]|nr:cystathionine beta-lyase [Flavobacteriaceae bacterium]|tara:strand:- start:751 stop:1899 length:1149 start_codon:yes stop_codon:yes gene_type:complete
MKKNKPETLCVHEGQIKDPLYNGAVSPLYMATAYSYKKGDMYPRYFNTPNQVGLSKKISSLENAEESLVFGSGMAAISTSLLSFLSSGDHVIFQPDLYGGTRNFATEHLNTYGIEYSFANSININDFCSQIKSNTKVIYVETPSNPLMKIIDLKSISELAKDNNIITIIDNTFASPVNQNPISLGIDIVIHSATKYLGGHSDILAGSVSSSKKNMEYVFSVGKSLGGNLSDYTVWLLERSLKTLFVRVEKQNKNANELAKHLQNHECIEKVFYPGLENSIYYNLAKNQMKDFTGMLSFEINKNINREIFENSLGLIQPAISLAGVESTINVPYLTSHKWLPKQEKRKQGISENLVRFSVGIEDVEDLKRDLNQALKKASNES